MCGHVLQEQSATGGAGMSVLPGAARRIWWRIPSSVATMNACFGDVTTRFRRPDVDATKAACARMRGSHSGCAMTSASGWRVTRSRSFCSENVSWTTHVPGQTTNFRSSFFSSHAARLRSGAKTTGSGICRRMTSADDDVTMTSDRAFTPAEQLM